MTPGLNKSFLELQTYQRDGYRLLPMRFLWLDSDRYIVTNLAGGHRVITRGQLDDLVNHRLPAHSSLYDDLKGDHFLADGDSDVYAELLSTRYRTRQANLPNFTALHLFVVTLRCDHSCQYCQVSRVSEDRTAYDMTPQIADRAIDLMFHSPSPYLKVEFQGGEPLLNFGLIQHIVNAINRRNDGRHIQFVITSNLSTLTDGMLDFCATHRIYFSTSLDGPAGLHNHNRPRPTGDSHARTVDGIQRVRKRLGENAVSALMTSTAESLKQPEAIIDEYVRLGFRSIFLRYISPYGFATRNSARIGYETERFIDFFKQGLQHIIELNALGAHIHEVYSRLLLQRILTPYPTNYVDLQSPAGMGLSVLVYNYDGDVYASDEGRMLAEMGDKTFRLGTVYNTHRELFLNSNILPMVFETMLEALPGLLRLRALTVLWKRPSFSLSHSRRHRRSPSWQRVLQAQHGADASPNSPLGRRSPGSGNSEELGLMHLSASIPKTPDGEPFIARIGEHDLNHADKDVLDIWRNQQALPDGFRRVLKVAAPGHGEITIPKELEYLSAGDIVRVNLRAGEIRVLYRRNSPHNTLFFTDRCNSRCLMCSQPPRAVEDGYLVEEILTAIPLMSPCTRELCITGGEPTLLGKRFLDVIEATKRWLPDTSLHVLSNGRLFTVRFAGEIVGIGHPNLMIGIPLYSDIGSKHDFIVQAKGAFDETVRGITNLARCGQQIEIRFVIHKQTFERLPQTARFIARNFPFVTQVALMGLEMMGFAKANLNALWIDPAEYQAQLCAAVTELSQSRIKVMIYNHQLCLLARQLWPFARKSISDWKNIYMPQCKECSIQESCGGFFASAKLRCSKRIKPFCKTPP
jgi:His-Xaa-Ser system radical SAM maturase HxsB/His-Xaa-Ser system radical SAM maturase HxsC